MGGKAKSVYLSVVDLKTHKTIFRRVFHDAKGYNENLKDVTFQEQYPPAKFYYVKEVY
jgi:hypothetical protein